MKKNRIFKTISGAALCTALLTGCSESWLEPKPLSFLLLKMHTLMLTVCSLLWQQPSVPCVMNTLETEVDILVNLSSPTSASAERLDKAGPLQDMDRQLMPDANFNNAENSYLTSHNWDENWNQIKYTNVVLSRMKDTKFVNEAEKNKVLGTGYFQRCYRYWRLINQFGMSPSLMSKSHTHGMILIHVTVGASCVV